MTDPTRGIFTLAMELQSLAHQLRDLLPSGNVAQRNELDRTQRAIDDLLQHVATGSEPPRAVSEDD